MVNNLAILRDKKPLVHCITNYVSMDITANTLLAVGASPAMIHTPEETTDFSKVVGAVTINIGTLSPHWLKGMKNAINGANQSNVPWVLDPVAHFATPYRNKATSELISLSPSIIRGNASEILALDGAITEAKGVDSEDEVETALEASKKLAVKNECIIIITGEVDLITDGTKVVRVSGGSEEMARVTAMGCSLTCLLGAFVAITDPMSASINATTLFAEAGNRAHTLSHGPASFRMNFIDQLAQISNNEFASLNWAN
tara:strand:- start:4698 stop:5471 length:774 start_codon:yes stop_codon:yes gene_type:complete